MRSELELPDFDRLYRSAKESFRACISGKDRAMLQSEISTPLDEIVTKKDFVRITFTGKHPSTYLLETKLTLQAPNGNDLGYYCLHQNENGDCVDDFLVFE